MTHIPVHIYNRELASALFTLEEAALVLMMCTSLDKQDKFVYTIKKRPTLWRWYLTVRGGMAVSGNTDHLTCELIYVVTRKRKNAGRHKQVYVLRQTLTQLKRMEIDDGTTNGGWG